MALWGAAAAAAAVWIFGAPLPGGAPDLRGVGRFLLMREAGAVNEAREETIRFDDPSVLRDLFG